MLLAGGFRQWLAVLVAGVAVSGWNAPVSGGFWTVGEFLAYQIIQWLEELGR